MFLIWTGIGILTHIRYYFLFPSKPEMLELSMLLGIIACYYPWIALTPAVFHIEKRFPLGTGRWIRNLSLLALISLPFCLLASPLMKGSFYLVMYFLTDLEWSSHYWFSWIRELPVAEAIFWCSVVGGYLIRTLFQLREQERRVARLALEKSQLEAGLNQAQLEVLRIRLNPHFLFNSLQNISVLIKQDPQTASRMVARLGDLLRSVLRQDSLPESTLQEEIELTQTYVALEQMRFGDRLHVEFEIARGVQSALVPSFLFQPLVENAIIHGLHGVRKTGIIAISAVGREGQLALAVTDNGIGPQTEDPASMKTGVGLRSTRERLERMYPDRHSFSIQKPAEGGTKVSIAIPLHFAHEEEPSLHRHEQPAFVDC